MARRKEEKKPPPPANLPDREELIALCDRALAVSQDDWSNRDTARATMQLGQAYALLRAGCDFYITDLKMGSWWVTITYKGFDYFEGTFEGMGPLDDDSFYIPTLERLDSVQGKDWY